MAWLDQVKWNDDGLVPVITQELSTKQVLTLAWMNRESLQLTVDTGHAVYWSRSRQKLWHKGEQSGNQQQIKSIRLDCDCDAVLLEVVQVGGIACHTGRHHCFYQQLVDGEWQTTETVLKDPKEMYKPKETSK
ncbi:MAG: phosphoribosyl-AMP cyclohydrolase [Pseudomonadota bacterium]|nr:phosphoribosyl-AMP cyclohydrolase [Pseudomonadota bacterium]MDO7711016.1 phosphoribosyl-AMP cyclohydrolase [Pseudomonadota bacterium]